MYSLKKLQVVKMSHDLLQCTIIQTYFGYKKCFKFWYLLIFLSLILACHVNLGLLYKRDWTCWGYGHPQFHWSKKS